jgi:gamma-glutamyl:cysteine ligase YbdK (ATP-grasp superfamily)
VPTLRGLAAALAREVRHVDARLAPLGARLMPTGMHPWMDPTREFELWPHGDREIYAAFHRIFDCAGHGWANLQSVHLNFPFGDDAEFGRLHAALRFLLPILPALAASSPLVEGRRSAWLDARLEHYRANARRVPSVTGQVVPEAVFTRADYEERVLERIYADLAPHDPGGTLRHEWVNARGCIARFERSAIEVRVLDVQECPQADVAIAAAVRAVARALSRDDAALQRSLRAWDTGALARLFDAAVAQGDAARVDDAAYLAALGVTARPRRAGEVWAELVERYAAPEPGFDEWSPALRLIAAEGCLARRILLRLGEAPRREAIREVYLELCECLSHDRLFHARP